MSSVLFGTLAWGGEHKGMPAVVGSYYGGASLYVYSDGKWRRYAKGESVASVTPHKCKGCDEQLPRFQEQVK